MCSSHSSGTCLPAVAWLRSACWALMRWWRGWPTGREQLRMRGMTHQGLCASRAMWLNSSVCPATQQWVDAMQQEGKGKAINLYPWLGFSWFLSCPQYEGQHLGTRMLAALHKAVRRLSIVQVVVLYLRLQLSVPAVLDFVVVV
jgi:hypothetical protein